MFRCISAYIQNHTAINFNYADLSQCLPQSPTHDLHGHEHGAATLSWHNKRQRLASSGYDGTVRIWCPNREQTFLENTLVFQKSTNEYGNDLHGKLIEHIAWSTSGKYIAASLENVLNIWTPSDSGEIPNIHEKNWFNEVFQGHITAITWSKSETDDACEYLLIGQITGAIHLITLASGNECVEEIITPGKTFGMLHQ